MGRTSSVTSLALSLVSTLIAATFMSSPASAAGRSSRPIPSPQVTKHYSRFKWDIGVMIWTEKVHFSSGSTETPVVSNATGLVVGGDWRRGSATSGWLYQAGLMYGNITNQAESNTIVYQKGRDRTYGAQGGVGVYYRSIPSRIELSLLAQARYRKADHTVPPGYTFGKDDQIIAGFGELDLMVPVTSSFTLFQQLSVPVTDKRMDTTWVFGVRL